MEVTTGPESNLDRNRVVELLDKDIREAAAQLVGHDLVDDYPQMRFVLLCVARAEFEDEKAVGADSELRWVPVARDVFVAAAKDKQKREKNYFSFPHLLSESPSATTWQHEIYHKTIASLMVVNTDESPDAHQGDGFAAQVAEGYIQIRYV